MSLGILLALAAVAAPPQLPVADVDLLPKNSAIEVTYRFAVPVKSFDWSVSSQGLRTKRLTPLDGISVDNATVSSPEPRRIFRFRLAEDTEAVPATYPIAQQTLDGGWMVFDRYFQVRDTKVVFHYSVDSREQTFADSGSHSHYIVLRNKGAQPFETTPWVATSVARELAAAQAAYTEAFGPLGFTPEIVFARRYPGDFLRGDVTSARQIVFSLSKGAGWDVPNANAETHLRTIVWHETAHLWNSLRSRNSDDTGIVWEGGAEYLAYAGLLRAGEITPSVFGARLTQAVNQCALSLGHETLTDWRTLSGWGIYDCGFVQHWLADGAPMKAGAVGQAVTPMWSALMVKPTFTTAQFDEQASRAPLYHLFAQVVETRDWASFGARLRAGGVAISELPDPARRLMFDLAHVVTMNCPADSSYGAGMAPWWLETKGCGTLPENPKITAVDGIDLDAAPAEAAAHVEAVCRAGGSLTFSHRDTGPSGAVVCKSALPLPPLTFRVDFDATP